MQQTIPPVADTQTARSPLSPTAAKLLLKSTLSEQSCTATASKLTPIHSATDALQPLSSSSEVRGGDEFPSLGLHFHVTNLYGNNNGNTQERDAATTSAVMVETGAAAATAQDGTAASARESRATPAEDVPPAAHPPPAMVAESATSASCVSSSLEPLSIAQLRGLESRSGKAVAAGAETGGQTSFEHLRRPIHLMSAVPTASATKHRGFRGHGGVSGDSVRVSGHRELRQGLSVLRHLTFGGAAGHRRDNFSGVDGVSYENFFFRSEDTAVFGVGTVGLFASTAKPVTGASRTTTRGSPPSAHHHRTHGNRGQRSAPQSLCVPPSCRASALLTSNGAGAVGTAPCYYTPACYTSPAVDGVTAWKQRQENYQKWRRENLKASTYYRLSKPSGARGGAGTAADASDSAAPLHDINGAPTLCLSEERRRIERLRLRGLQAERTARSTARVHEQATYEEEVLLQRLRKLRGEAVDLPDCYLRATYPDPSTLTGYAERVAGDNQNRTYPAPHRSKAASGYLANPQRVVKDHHSAMQLHRVAMQQARLDREEQHLEAAERQRCDIAAQLTERQLWEAAYLASWMEGRPRLSRAREAERHARQEAEQRTLDQLNRTTQMHEREVYALYASQEAAVTAVHQKELRAQVVAPRLYSRRGISGGHSLDQEVQPLPATTAAQPNGAAARVSSPLSSGAPHSPGTASIPPQAAASPVPMVPLQALGKKSAPAVRPVTPAVRPATPALPPSQVVGPTSTNFFNEVKQWSREFPSPNVIPVNGADAAYRRAWKAELDEAQLRFNREMTQRQRKDITRGVQEACAKVLDWSGQRAKQGRDERRELAMRRANHTQADVEAATAVRLELQEEVHRAQQKRMVQATERHSETQFLRQQLKQREMVLRSLYAEELQQLRMTVSSASAANRG
nr:unnamed protein product [Leishmania braziliensis]